MGELLHFAKPARSNPKPVAASHGGQVVIFTGVRYERKPQSTPDKAGTAAKGGGRGA